MMKLVQTRDLTAPIVRCYSGQSGRSTNLAVSLPMLVTLVLFLTAAAGGARRVVRYRGAPLPDAQATEDRKDATLTQEPHESGFGRKPHQGWLYVLDWGETTSESRVLLVDPDKGRVAATINAGRDLDGALSPDGTHLYLAFTIYNDEGRGRKDFLEVINTRTGAVVKLVKNPDRWISTGPQYAPSMAFSPDGRWLYVFKHSQEGSTDTYYVATFDTVARQFLPGRAMVPDCVAATLVPWSKQEGLTVICSGTSDLRFLQLSENGGVVRHAGGAMSASSRLSLWSKGVEEHGRRVGPAFLSPDGRTMTVLMGDGRLFKIDNEARAIMHTDVIDRDGRGVKISQGTNSNQASLGVDDWLAAKWIRYQSSELSADGRRVYLGVGWLAHLHQGVQEFSEVEILDSQTLNRLGTIKTRYPFASFAVSNGDRRLYALSPEQACIMVVDTESRRESRTIDGVGTRPFRVIVAH